VQSEVGLISITGTDDRPAKVGISVADIAAGIAYAAILTALFVRTGTGCGTSIEVSLFDALGEWMQAAAYYTAYGGSAPPRTGADHASIAPYGAFRAGDGGQVYLGIQNAREWTRFCAEVLQRADLADDERFRTNPARVRNRQALHAEVEAAFAPLSTGEVIARLDAARIAYARMNSVADYLAHPQLAGRDCWRTIGSPVGPPRAVVPPARMSGLDAAMGDVPALGQHTDAILAELGVAPETIAAWRKEAMV
jgi:itaconate CoA-transferase